MNLLQSGEADDALVRSFSQISYDYLVERILGGEYQPGEEINRKLVAEQLGISQAPVNEAVSRLESEGLLDVSPRRQTRVRVIRREELRALLILREAIECQAARIYCGNPVIANRKRLKELARAVDATKAGTRTNELAEVAFHHALIDLVGSPMICEEFRKLMRRRLFYKINLLMPWSAQPSLDSHETLLKNLQTNDPDKAEAVMRRHLERGREKILQ